jgi:serine/threonine-protein kinase
VAGGNGKGSNLTQLDGSYGIFVDENGTVYVADSFNRRVVKWKPNALSGELVAGGRGRGNASDQLTEVADVIVDKNGTMYITDHQNGRVQQWFPGAQTGQTIIEINMANGIAQDDEGSLYVSQWSEGKVIKWRKGQTQVILSNLGLAVRVFVDQYRTVYVADQRTDRVIRKAETDIQGSVVAGGSPGNDTNQLNCPNSVLVDKSGNVYVSDAKNNRIMCWSPGAKSGTLIVGGKGAGSESDQLNAPYDLAFDQEENLYVLDRENQRVQKFVIDKNLVSNK